MAAVSLFWKTIIGCRDVTCKRSVFNSNILLVFFYLQITYSGSKSYKENGELKQLSHNREVKLDAVSPGVQSYMLEGLVPHTTYQIELSAFNSMGEGPKIRLALKTDKGRPPSLQRPVIIGNELSDEFVSIELEPASERNGPIRYDRTHFPHYKISEQ